MSPVFLDTSGIIALLHRGDVHHARASQLASGFVGSGRRLLTTTAVLAESGDGFARKGRWSVISQFLAALLADPKVDIVTVDAALIIQACELRHARPDKQWGLTDCLSFVTMAREDVQEAFTADRHFQQAGFTALLLPADET